MIFFASLLGEEGVDGGMYSMKTWEVWGDWVIYSASSWIRGPTSASPGPRRGRAMISPPGSRLLSIRRYREGR